MQRERSAATSVALHGRLRSEERRWFYLFISPWIVGFSAFTLYPLVASLYFSLTNYSILEPPVWTGLSNYIHLFTDNLFWHSVEVTSIYAASTVFLQLTVAMIVALLLNMRVPGMRLLRTIYYLPNVLPIAATSMLWIFLFLPQFGLIDWVIKTVTGLNGPNWLSDPAWALPALILMSLWGIGSAMIIFLAGLQSIPPVLYEAAALDGVGVWHRFWKVTFPMVSPVVLFNLIMGLIGASQTFVQVYMMTQGGPDYATYFYNYYLYQNAFEYFKMGTASAQAWIMLIVVMALSVVIFSTSARWVYYGGVEHA